MKARDKIYLVGFMGSGKTTTGKKLASSLGWSFLDLDTKITEMAGMDIPRIFSHMGEAFFREIESAALRETNDLHDTVVATGGGAPCHHGNMEFMKNAGLTVYLKLNPGQLGSRLAGSGNERPLISGMTGDELVKFISEKLEVREADYSKAELITDGADIDVQALAMSVRSRL